jgi:cysteinyl-tRNA synthetase
VHLDDAKQALSRLYTALKGVAVVVAPVDWSNAYAARFKVALDDDFNTPEAVAVLFDLANEVNKSHSPADAGLLKSLAGLLGLLQRESEAFLQAGTTQGDWTPELIEAAIVARAAAKKAKQFSEADRIRDELKSAGVILEDSAAGTTWRRS